MIHLVPVKVNVHWSFWLEDKWWLSLFSIIFLILALFILCTSLTCLSLSFYATEEEVVENFDISNLPEEVLQNIEADSYWCMSKLLDGIQVNWFFLSVSSGDNRLMSWLWTTARFLRKSTSMKNRIGVDFLTGEICCKFAIALRKGKRSCATSFHQNVYMFHCSMIFWSRVEVSSSRGMLCTSVTKRGEHLLKSPMFALSLRWWEAGLFIHVKVINIATYKQLLS